MNARKCALCDKAGADTPLHLHVSNATLNMIGDYAHASCLLKSFLSQRLSSLADAERVS